MCMFSVLFQFVIPIIFILGLVLFVSASLNLSFEKATPISILGSVLLTFLFGFIDLRVGIFVSLFFAFASIPIAIMKTRQKKYDFSVLFINTYFFAFLIIYIFIFALNSGKCFDRWDEYSHWGMMTKEMYRLNKYYYVKKSVLVAHREYPPFTQIWQYIWCKIIGTFKESSLYNAKLTLCLSILLSAFSHIMDKDEDNKLYNQKNTHRSLYGISLFVLVILFAAVPALADGSMYRTIYAEGTLVVLTVYSIVCILIPTDDKRYNLVSYALSLASLSLVKQIGIVFASISLLMLLVRLVVVNFVKDGKGSLYFPERSNEREDTFKQAVLGVLSLFVPWFIWSRVTKVYTDAGQFDSSRFTISGIVDVIQGRGTVVQYKCIDDYVHSLFMRPLTWIPGTSYFVISVALIVILVVGYSYSKNSALENVDPVESASYIRRTVAPADIILLIIVLPITIIGYAFVMQVLYLFGFSDQEMQGLACFQRYMNTILGVWSLVVIFVMHGLSTYTSRRILIKNTIMAIICLFIIGAPRLKYEFLPGIMTTNNEGLFASDAERIREYTPEGSHIYFVDTMGNDSATNIVRFFADGRFISDFFVAPKASDYDRVVQYMRKYEYIYLDNIDEEFITAYGGLFSDGSGLSRQQMYKIDSDGENMVLSYVDMSE